MCGRTAQFGGAPVQRLAAASSVVPARGMQDLNRWVSLPWYTVLAHIAVAVEYTVVIVERFSDIFARLVIIVFTPDARRAENAVRHVSASMGIRTPCYYVPDFYS
jgi:hypothetical protein